MVAGPEPGWAVSLAWAGAPRPLHSAAAHSQQSPGQQPTMQKTDKEGRREGGIGPIGKGGVEDACTRQECCARMLRHPTHMRQMARYAQRWMRQEGSLMVVHACMRSEKSQHDCMHACAAHQTPFNQSRTHSYQPSLASTSKPRSGVPGPQPTTPRRKPRAALRVLRVPCPRG